MPQMKILLLSAKTVLFSDGMLGIPWTAQVPEIVLRDLYLEILSIEDRKTKLKSGLLSRTVSCTSFDIKQNERYFHVTNILTHVRFIFGTEFGNIEIYSYQANTSIESIKTYQLFKEPIYKSIWSPNGQHLLCIGCDYNVK